MNNGVIADIGEVKNNNYVCMKWISPILKAKKEIPKGPLTQKGKK